MSELMTQTSEPKFRSSLLSTVCSATFVVLVAGTPAVAAAGDDTTVWIDIGTELNRAVGQADPYLPPFTAAATQFGLPSPAAVQRPPRFGLGSLAKIEIDPADSPWEFSASLKYGRSSRKQYLHKELPAPFTTANGDLKYIHRTIYHPQNRTADYNSKLGESHSVIDFSAGRDVGIGLFGSHSDAQLNFGVRFAQLTESSTLALRADPNPHFYPSVYVPGRHKYIANTYAFQSYRNSPTVSRSFSGIGPTLSWNESVPLAGSVDDGAEITFDWGANIALLFGRQKVTVQHHTSTDLYKKQFFHTGDTSVTQYGFTDHHYTDSSVSVRRRSVVSPNVGAVVGLSFRFSHAKVSLGYKADFFLNAMDGGVSDPQSITRGFHGPFASMSIGLGG